MDAPIVFLTAAGGKHGFGHLSRCMTISDALRLQSAESQILIGAESPLSEIPNAITKKLEFPLWVGSTGETRGLDPRVLKTLEALGPKAIVVDTYGVSVLAQRQLQTIQTNITLIDDVAQHEIIANKVVNYGPGFSEKDYAGLVKANTALHLGHTYFPVSANLLGAKKNRSAQDSLVICLGGSDPENHTHLLTEYLKEVHLDFEKIIIINGKANQLADRRLKFLHHPSNYHDLIAGARCVVGAAGLSALERQYLEINDITVVIAENQKRNFNYLTKKRHTYGHTWQNSAQDFKKLIENCVGQPKLEKMSISDSGTNLIADVILND